MMWMFANVVLASCDRVVTTSEIDQKLGQAEETLADGDLERYGEILAFVDVAIVCLVQPLTPAQAARSHRLRGILAHGNNATDVSLAHFQTARRLEPTVPLPVYPEGHPLQKAFAEERPTHTVRLGPPREGTVFVDGGERTTIDVEGSHLLQHRLGPGEPLEFRLLDAGTLPPWMDSLPKRRAKTGLRIAGVGLLAVGGGMWAGNALSGSHFVRCTSSADACEETTPAKIRGWQSRTNALGATALTFTGLGAGMLVVERVW